MQNEGFTLTSEYWQAIIHNDSSYDNRFFYAVKSTGIFCRPSCKSRIPNKNNVRIFLNAEQALHENFRPCKRCKPNGITLPNKEWVEQIKDCIEKHFDEVLTLDILAEMCHGSPLSFTTHVQKNDRYKSNRIYTAIQNYKSDRIPITYKSIHYGN